MTKRARWSPRLLPAVRRNLIKACEAEITASQALKGPMTAQIESRIALIAERAAHLRLAELYWVTDPMQRLALDASQDIPGVTSQDRPSLHGLMGFPGPLPELDLPGTLHVPADGLLWRTMPEGHLQITLLTQPHRLPRPYREITGDFRYLVPIPGGDISGPLPYLFTSAPPAIDALVAFVATCWTMMFTPTVAQQRSLDSRTGSPSTPQTPPEMDVSIIDLRPLRHVNVDHDPTGRRLTVRHLVRGHWRNQAHGPEHAEHRLIYIAPYIKGPSWAPLKTTSDRVMAWRRA